MFGFFWCGFEFYRLFTFGLLGRLGGILSGIEAVGRVRVVLLVGGRIFGCLFCISVSRYVNEGDRMG